MLDFDDKTSDETTTALGTVSPSAHTIAASLTDDCLFMAARVRELATRLAKENLIANYEIEGMVSQWLTLAGRTLTLRTL